MNMEWQQRKKSKKNLGKKNVVKNIEKNKYSEKIDLNNNIKF